MFIAAHREPLDQADMTEMSEIQADSGRPEKSGKYYLIPGNLRRSVGKICLSSGAEI